MSQSTNGQQSSGTGSIDLVAMSFGSSVGMWAAWYFTHLPGLIAPMPLGIALMLGVLFCGGFLSGKFGTRGWKGGALIGLFTWILNLLVLGSLVSGHEPGQIVPQAPLWLGTSLAVSLVVGILGAAVGTTRRDSRRPPANWPGVQVAVTAVSTLLLLLAGGLVTSADAGLAVPDWPQSFGYNMFLFPLQKMTNGIYFEHAHRLFGALVGLSTLSMAICLQVAPVRRNLRIMGWIAFALVAFQGTLGGVRVDDKSVALAFFHGVLGQLFFAYMIALATLASDAFAKLCANRNAGSSQGDRSLSIVTFIALLIQLGLGASVRHFHTEGSSHSIMAHMTVGVLVLGLIIAVAVTTWGKYPGITLLRRTSMGLLHATIAQLVLGFITLASGVLNAVPGQATSSQLIFATIHQGVGALVLAWTMRMVILTHRPLAETSGNQEATS